MTQNAGLAIGLTPELTFTAPTDTTVRGTKRIENRWKSLADMILLRRSIMPILLVMLYWGAVGGTLYGTWWLFSHQNWAWTMSLIFGNLLARALFEILTLKFRSLDQRLRIIDDLIQDQLETQKRSEV